MFFSLLHVIRQSSALVFILIYKARLCVCPSVRPPLTPKSDIFAQFFSILCVHFMLSQWYFCFVKRRWNTILPRFEGAHIAYWKASSLELCFAEIWMIRNVREWSEYKAGSSLGWRNWFYYFNERWWRIASDQQETQYTSHQPSLIRKHEIKLAFLPPQPPVNMLNFMNELFLEKNGPNVGIYCVVKDLSLFHL